MRTFAGAMTYPDGTARPGTFTIVALTSVANIARGSAVRTATDDQGMYSVSLEPNIYRLYFREQASTDPVGGDIGVAKVLSDGQESSLLDLISITAGFHPPDDPFHHNHHCDAPTTIYIIGGGATDTGIEEAPEDGAIYARQDKQWVAVELGGSEAEDPSLEVITVGELSGLVPSLPDQTRAFPYKIDPQDNGKMLLCGGAAGGSPSGPINVIKLPGASDDVVLGFQIGITNLSEQGIRITTDNGFDAFFSGTGADGNIVDQITFANPDPEGFSLQSIKLRTQSSVGHIYLCFKSETPRSALDGGNDDTPVIVRFWVASGDFAAFEDGESTGQ